jgi:hypothetical protein
VPIVLKSGSLKLLEHSGPVQACNGIALPLIIGATGNISKSFRNYLNNITGKHDCRELQTTAALGTAHILRKEITYEYKTFSMGNSIRGSTNCTERLQQYTP